MINFSHVVAENTPKGLAAQKFAEIVNQKSDGKVKIEVYSNGVLYSDDEELAALRRNDVQMIAPSISKLTDLSPTWQLFDLPFIFDDYSEAKQVFTGKIGQDLLSTLQEKNIKGLALWSNGFKQMTSNTKPLLHPADFQGQTFRIMPSEVIKNNSNFLALSLRLSRLIKYINPLNDRNLMDKKIRFLIFIQNVCTSCKNI